MSGIKEIKESIPMTESACSQNWLNNESSYLGISFGNFTPIINITQTPLPYEMFLCEIDRSKLVAVNGSKLENPRDINTIMSEHLVKYKGAWERLSEL